MKYPHFLLQLIDSFKKLPGIGQKSAERFAFDLLSWSKEEIQEFSSKIEKTASAIQFCHFCGCILEKNVCQFCKNEKRDLSVLCIVSSVKDVFAIEQTKLYQGLYYVLGGLLSPFQNKGPEILRLAPLESFLEKKTIEEIVIALDSTLEGDATSLYLREELAHFSIPISRLAFGLPMGSSLDYVDGGTLAKAFSARNRF